MPKGARRICRYFEGVLTVVISCRPSVLVVRLHAAVLGLCQVRQKVAERGSQLEGEALLGSGGVGEMDHDFCVNEARRCQKAQPDSLSYVPHSP